MDRNYYMRGILNALIDKYEKSEAIPPKASMKPNEVYRDYGKSTVSIHEVGEFESAVGQLEANGFVTVKRPARQTTVDRISLNTQKTDTVYAFLNRRRKADMDQAYISYLEHEANGDFVILDRYCADQIDKIRKGYKPFCEYEQAALFIGILRCVLGNRAEIFERGFSIGLFFRESLRGIIPDNVSKSKYFTNEFRKKVAAVLAAYGSFDDLLAEAETDTEKEHALLSEFGIVPNETVVYVKGNAELIFGNSDRIRTRAGEITPIMSDKLVSLTEANLFHSSVTTIENLASFKQISGDSFYIYVAGYHKDGQNSLIRCIQKSGEVTDWRHFGDLDPWGFRILLNLRKRTGADFHPWEMGIPEYLNPRLAPARIPLSENDRQSAELLLREGQYSDIMKLMLEKGYKLEQEAISFCVADGD